VISIILSNNGTFEFRLKPDKSSFRWKPESSHFKMFWTPASAGVTIEADFQSAFRG